MKKSELRQLERPWCRCCQVQWWTQLPLSCALHWGTLFIPWNTEAHLPCAIVDSIAWNTEAHLPCALGDFLYSMEYRSSPAMCNSGLFLFHGIQKLTCHMHWGTLFIPWNTETHLPRALGALFTFSPLNSLFISFNDLLLDPTLALVTPPFLTVQSGGRYHNQMPILLYALKLFLALTKLRTNIGIVDADLGMFSNRGQCWLIVRDKLVR